MGILDKLIASATPYTNRPHIRFVGGIWICSRPGTHVGLGWGATPQAAYFKWWSGRVGSKNTVA
jgi:hypothetical protein